MKPVFSSTNSVRSNDFPWKSFVQQTRSTRLAGVTPLGVAWGWHDPEVLEEAGAERIADSPADLLAIVAPELSADFLGVG